MCIHIVVRLRHARARPLLTPSHSCSGSFSLPPPALLTGTWHAPLSTSCSFLPSPLPYPLFLLLFSPPRDGKISEQLAKHYSSAKPCANFAANAVSRRPARRASLQRVSKLVSLYFPTNCKQELLILPLTNGPCVRILRRKVRGTESPRILHSAG
jgi:hypothetical protein